MDEKGKKPEKSQARLVYTHDEVFVAARYAIEIGRKNSGRVDDLQRNFEILEQRVLELRRYLNNIGRINPN